MCESVKKQEKFLQYAASPYAGIDGGDENAEYWFVGMEWSAHKDFFESFEDWEKHEEKTYKDSIDIDNGDWAFEKRLNHIYQTLPHKTADKIFAAGSNSFKLNLFPLSFKNKAEKEQWANDAAAQQTGFASFAEYQKRVIPARYKLFADLLQKKQKAENDFLLWYRLSGIFCGGFRFAIVGFRATGVL